MSAGLAAFLAGRAPARPNPDDGGAGHPLADSLRTMSAAAARLHPGGAGRGRWPDVYGFVLARGHAPRTRPLAPDEAAVVAAAVDAALGRRRAFLQHQCFWNAAQLVLSDRTGRLGYVEGYVGVRGVPLLHAWAEIGGACVDPTIRPEGDPAAAGPPPADLPYWGVAVPRARVLARLVAAGAAGSVVDDMTYGWPFVHGDAPPDGPFPEYDAGGRRRRP